jgi:LysM repeat protein
MPDYKPNQFVRAFAVLALIAAIILVVVAVATSGGGSGGGGGDNGDSHHAHVSKAGQRAVHKGVWIVQPGDTLGAISLKTGIDVATLQALNPDLDPQTLNEGQRIALR